MAKRMKTCIQRPFLTATSVAAILAGLAAPSLAAAQAAPTPAPAPSETATPQADSDASSGGTDIIVTGVRGAPRSKTDSPTPVDVLSGKELADGGHANLYNDLQILVPSFNMPTKAGSGTATAIQTGALRGLNPDQTLVLVNGQRWHHTSLINVGNGLYNGSAPVDLGLIPASGIERIEVLREGAAAQYGSDAIAGVINIILKESTGGSLSAQYGQNFDRSDGELLLVRGDYGLKLGDTGKFNLFFGATRQEQSDRSVPIDPSIQLYPKLANGQPDPRELTTNRQINHSFGITPFTNLQVGYNASNQFGGVELYSFGVLNRRISDIPYPLIYANSKDALPQVYPSGINPLFKIREIDGQAALGLRGDLSGWGWDLSTTAGENHARQNMYNAINASLGPTSPTQFYIGTFVNFEWTNSLDVSKKLDLGGAGSLQVSFGLQDRFERFKIEAGESSSYAIGTYVIPAGQPFAGQSPTPGTSYTPGFRPADSGSWGRNIFSAYSELGWEPTDRLFIGVAGRYEHYNDTAGSSVVGKIDGRYKLTNWLALRGSFGNGFRAPSLAQAHYSAAKAAVSTAPATLGQIITTAVLPVDSQAAIALGAAPLTPEKSVDTSVGITLTPTKNFTLTVDGYIVKVDDRIALTGILQGAAVNNILVAAGQQPNLAAQYFTNAIDTRTIGLDVVGSYRVSLGDAGNLRLSAALNLNDTKIRKIIPNPSQLTALGSSFVLFDRTAQGYLVDGIPKSKLAIGANWDWKLLTLNVQELRYGGFWVRNNTVANDRYFGPAWITNVSVKVKLSAKVSLAVGADNLFNKYPPAIAIPLTQFGYNQYPRTSPYGFTGGSYYGRVQINF